MTMPANSSAPHVLHRTILMACLAAGLVPLIAHRARGHGEPFVIDYAAATNRLTVAPGVYDFFNVDENLATPGFGLPISTTYPGFSRADTLPANTAVTLRFTTPLTYWNPTTGPLDPLPVASGTIDVVNRAAAIATVAATGIGGTNPLFLDTFVGFPGEHHHFTAYELVTPDAPGLYGLWAEATATGPSYPGGATTASSPFLIVLNWGIEDEQQYQDGVTRLSVLPAPLITITVGSGTQTQGQAGYPLLSGTIPVVKAGAGTLIVDQANTLTGSTTIQQGTLRLAHPSALATSTIVPLAGGTLAITPFLQTTVGGLATNAGGLIDVGSGMITVASGLSTVDMLAAIVTGRDGGSWSGTSGITSSVAAADSGRGVPRSVGWLEKGDGSVTFAYAAPGDTNLDWSIDILDAANILALGKFDTDTAASWLDGDFNYDGLVDILDVADFVATGLFNAGDYNPLSAAGMVATVPEPTVGLVTAVMAALAFVARSRRC
ncbi:MAG: autotransporter-associated beta strand repeat-containing protein [Pirellulales bacterium]